jgi:hypothetical protein
MKGRLFSATMLVIVLVLMLAVPASAGKPPDPALEVTFNTFPTTLGSEYSPFHSVALAGYKGDTLEYKIVWYDSTGPIQGRGVSLAIKTAEAQTLWLPTANYLTFTVGTCDLASTQYGEERFDVRNKKGISIAFARRSLPCRLHLVSEP